MSSFSHRCPPNSFAVLNGDIKLTTGANFYDAPILSQEHRPHEGLIVSS